MKAETRSTEIIGVLALTLAAALPRLVALGSVPSGLHGDEAWTGLEALRVLREGGIGVWSPSALGQPAGPFYWVAAVFLALEPGIASLRAAMALLGVLTVPASYVFYRVLFGPRVAFLGAALLAAGFWHIHYSRIAFPPVTMPLVEAFAFAALFAAFKRGTRASYLIAGGLLGLGIYTYIPYPFVAAGVAVFLLGWAGVEIRRRRAVEDVLLRLGVLVAGGLATAAPFLLFIARNPGPYLGYGGNTLIPLMEGGLGAKLGELASRLTEVPGHFFFGRPIDFTDGMGAQPLLDIITGLLFLTGLGLTLREWRSRRTVFLLVVLVFGLLPALLSGDNWGENRRLIGALPVVYLLAAVGLAWASDGVASWVGRGRAWVSPVIVGLLLVIVAGMNLRAYFIDYSQADTTRWVFTEELTSACLWLNDEAAGRRVYFYSGRWTYRYETCRFLAPDIDAKDRSREFGTFSLEKDTLGPVVYLFLPPYLDLVDQVATTHPGGARTEGRQDGRLLFVAYAVG